MSYIINGKVKRNTTEQVLENAKDIIDLQSDVSALQEESSTVVQEVSDLGQRVEEVATDLGNLETSVVNKTATHNVVYGNGSNGDAAEYPISVTGSPTAGSIATFDASGRLQSLSPTSNSDVATKQYVDSHAPTIHLYRHRFYCSSTENFSEPFSSGYMELMTTSATPYAYGTDIPTASNARISFNMTGECSHNGNYGIATSGEFVPDGSGDVNFNFSYWDYNNNQTGYCTTSSGHYDFDIHDTVTQVS